MKTDYDAIIVGAGPAGSTAAILLASAGWSVALVEKQSFPRRKVCGGCIGASNLLLLATLGIGDAFGQLAGPELREFALYCGDRVLHAPLPALPDARNPWGRALGREKFDLLLLDRARELGVSVWQPWFLRAMRGSAGAFRCEIETHPAAELTELRAPVVIMANGSWEGDRGGDRHAARRSSDLFAFKANFSGSQLAPGVLPVISFTGGYGGLVIAENGELTLAGCIRRDTLKACRAAARGQTAGEAFEAYLRAHTGALRNALSGARRDGRWLGIGPIQPGIRAPWHPADGRFVVGNAAAEAHPIIGEGISMAMQSAWLFAFDWLLPVARIHPRIRCDAWGADLRQAVEAGICAAPAPGRDGRASRHETLVGACPLAAHGAIPTAADRDSAGRREGANCTHFPGCTPTG